MAEMAADLGCSKNAVWHAMKRHAIARLPPKSRPGKNANWNGGRTTNRGYVMIRRPDHPHANRLGYVAEHRLVMEEQLGRYLAREEAVHHLDGDKANNAPSNLALYQSNGLHLQATLAGHTNNVTPQGREILRRPKSAETRERMRQAQIRYREAQRAASRSA